jgi:hypothetical protein
MDDDAAYPRFASRGRTFVYVLPCREQDLLKVGFSRDPMQRLRTLHPRFFDFFDLQRGLLVETGQLREARRIERLLITRFADHRAPAPLAVPQAAAGHTEWYRGVHPDVIALARDAARDGGFAVHPLHGWLRARMEERSDLLFDWSDRLLDAIDYARFNPPDDCGGVWPELARMEQALGRVLDACAALGMDVRALVAPAVFAWFQRHQGPGFR